MAKRKTKHRWTGRGYVVVTAAGKVKLDTICLDKESASTFMSIYDEEVGAKVRRVVVTCEW